MNLRSTNTTNQRTNKLNRIADNITRQKFTTNIDHEHDAERQRNNELLKKKNMTSTEPFWGDFNSTVTDICRQKEAAPRNKSMNRARGPSQPSMRNGKMNQTTKSFAIGHGNVEQERSQNSFGQVNGHSTVREKQNVRLEPIKATHKTPEVEIELASSTQSANRPNETAVEGDNTAAASIAVDTAEPSSLVQDWAGDTFQELPTAPDRINSTAPAE